MTFCAAEKFHLERPRSELCETFYTLANKVTIVLDQSVTVASSVLFKNYIAVSEAVAFDSHNRTISIIYRDKGGLIIEAVTCSIFGLSSYSFEHRLRYPVNHADNPQHILCCL